MSDSINPLHDLFIDEEQIKKQADELLSKTLAPYIKIVKSTHEVQLTPAGSSLKNSNKVMVTLAARLVLKRLGLTEDETMSQKELIDVLHEEGVAEGSVKSALNNLRTAKLLSKTPASRYYVGLDKLAKLNTELHGGNND